MSRDTPRKQVREFVRDALALKTQPGPDGSQLSSLEIAERVAALGRAEGYRDVYVREPNGPHILVVFPTREGVGCENDTWAYEPQVSKA